MPCNQVKAALIYMRNESSNGNRLFAIVLLCCIFATLLLMVVFWPDAAA